MQKFWGINKEKTESFLRKATTNHHDFLISWSSSPMSSFNKQTDTTLFIMDILFANSGW